MKQSLRARRMAKHHKRQQQSGKLNLVSLMDIFTILVFFLLVNSSDVEVLQTNKSITLPESQSEQRPDTTLIISVNSENILVGSRALAKTADVLASEETQIAVLAEELRYQAERAGPLTEELKEKGRAVTIMGDQSIPYALLKRIMATCAEEDYRDIALAVSKIPTAEMPEDIAPAPELSLVGGR